MGAHGVLDVDGRLAVDGLGVLLEHLALALDGRLVRLERVAEDAQEVRELGDVVLGAAGLALGLEVRGQRDVVRGDEELLLELVHAALEPRRRALDGADAALDAGQRALGGLEALVEAGAHGLLGLVERREPQALALHRLLEVVEARDLVLERDDVLLRRGHARLRRREVVGLRLDARLGGLEARPELARLLARGLEFVVVAVDVAAREREDDVVLAEGLEDDLVGDVGHVVGRDAREAHARVLEVDLHLLEKIGGDGHGHGLLGEVHGRGDGGGLGRVAAAVGRRRRLGVGWDRLGEGGRALLGVGHANAALGAGSFGLGAAASCTAPGGCHLGLGRLGRPVAMMSPEGAAALARGSDGSASVVSLDDSDEVLSLDDSDEVLSLAESAADDAAVSLADLLRVGAGGECGGLEAEAAAAAAFEEAIAFVGSLGPAPTKRGGFVEARSARPPEVVDDGADLEEELEALDDDADHGAYLASAAPTFSSGAAPVDVAAGDADDDGFVDVGYVEAWSPEVAPPPAADGGEGEARVFHSCRVADDAEDDDDFAFFSRDRYVPAGAHPSRYGGVLPGVANRAAAARAAALALDASSSSDSDGGDDVEFASVVALCCAAGAAAPPPAPARRRDGLHFDRLPDGPRFVPYETGADAGDGPAAPGLLVRAHGPQPPVKPAYPVKAPPGGGRPAPGRAGDASKLFALMSKFRADVARGGDGPALPPNVAPKMNW